MYNTVTRNDEDRTQLTSVLRDLSFAQINLLHCKKATFNLCRELTIKHTDVSLIQEPWIRGNKIHGFGHFEKRLFYNRAGKRPRAAVHVSPDVNAMLLNQFTNDDLVTVRICRATEDGGDFIVASSYMPYDISVPPPGDMLEKVVCFCKEKQTQLIIGADSNSHHTIWGSSNINVRGEELVQFLLKTDLMVQNRGNKPTFVNAIRKECLDITLATCKISELIHSWKVTDNETFSDHKLINFNLKGHFPLRKPFRNSRKTNWVKFRSILKQKLINVEHQDRYLSADSLEKANDICTAAIVEAYEASTY